jgi:chemotaxis response regulator CheB
VVYGMPRSAIEMGASDHVLPLDAIGEFVQALAVSGARS